CQALVPLAFFLAVSCVRTNLPHWSLFGFIPLFPALGAKWAAVARDAPARMHRRLALWAGTALLAAAVAVIQARLGVVSVRPDPALEMSGWTSVARELDARGLVGRPGTFLFTGRWFHSGQLAFAIRNRAPVLCYNAADARGFGYWSRPEDWL